MGQQIPLEEKKTTRERPQIFKIFRSSILRKKDPLFTSMKERTKWSDHAPSSGRTKVDLSPAEPPHAHRKINNGVGSRDRMVGKISKYRNIKQTIPANHANTRYL
jgi:hypothetical protein